MKENNSINEDGYSINKSFNYLVNLIENGTKDEFNEEQKGKEDSFINDFKYLYIKYFTLIIYSIFKIQQIK